MDHDPLHGSQSIELFEFKRFSRQDQRLECFCSLPTNVRVVQVIKNLKKNTNSNVVFLKFVTLGSLCMPCNIVRLVLKGRTAYRSTAFVLFINSSRLCTTCNPTPPDINPIIEVGLLWPRNGHISACLLVYNVIYLPTILRCVDSVTQQVISALI